MARWVYVFPGVPTNASSAASRVFQSGCSLAQHSTTAAKGEDFRPRGSVTRA
ncbi:hypothetical protein GOB94_05275 [Granulicella sp. 5B5]|uniref:hypothetical protein n=1 Tax=Granulicella sp. 5B5 TaxID=1617967 RepID=UPI0015F641C8|nr:hypothetical protein [Granulicella sp. 5B5]QMV18166.1 hypothetical protein GOB94_05275 [Granulicella sp. 5B5]